MQNEINELARNPEYQTIEDFLEYCMDDERTTFTHVELQALAFVLKTSGSKVRQKLESHGLTLAQRAPVRRSRGFGSNPNDRWYGPGACKSHGGSGQSQINGFAGQKG